MNFRTLTIAAAIVAMTSLGSVAPVYAQAAPAPAAAAPVSDAAADDQYNAQAEEELAAKLRADREQRGVGLGLVKELGGNAPQLASPDPGREPAGQLGPVDQPFWLRIASNK